jgi:hypothetical protein
LSSNNPIIRRGGAAELNEGNQSVALFAYQLRWTTVLESNIRYSLEGLLETAPIFKGLNLKIF